ncbi:MAG: hypothetical protein K1X56_10340 [Flavobacteriales bacterium]|nr:hypothetical protein [Flavobacteriales bacterium]
MSEKLLKSILGGLKILLMLVGTYVCYLIILGDGVDPDTGAQIPAEGSISFGLRLTYALMISSLVFWALFAALNILLNLKKNIVTLIGFALFAILCFIAYSMSSDAMLESWKYKDPNMFTPSNAKWSDAGLILMYIFSAITIFLIFAGEVWSLIKRFSK